jgi:cytidine deaminase
VSANPFHADPAVPERLKSCAPDRLAALTADAVQATRDGVLQASDSTALVARYGLAGVPDLMVLLLAQARALARPPISGFQVGAIGLEAPTGHLLFGHNIEFPGTHLGFSVHGEGNLAIRAFHRGTMLTCIALSEAHPCAHCRQTLAEFVDGDTLTLIDPLGHRLTLSQLYPWPFDPGYLGERGAIPGSINWPTLSPVDSGMAPALLQAGRRAHAPYSRCPAAVLLTLADGTSVTGSTIESVAFNPTIGPLQSALVELIAHGQDTADIRTATLGQVSGGAVDFAHSTAELLSRVAPQAALTILEWTP